MSGKTYLITGANRGLGYGLLSHYAALPNNTLIAAVRSPSTSQHLLALPTGSSTTIHVIQIDASSLTDPTSAVSTLQSLKITHIDVIIACAGIFKFSPLLEMPISEFNSIFQINTISSVLLYQAFHSLLHAAPRPKFAFMSGAGGSLNQMHEHPAPLSAHLVSKAAGNAFVVRMGIENDWLITLCINPGLVQTDLGNEGAVKMGLKEAPVTLEKFTKNTTFLIDHATKEEHSEKFFDETIDRIHPW